MCVLVATNLIISIKSDKIKLKGRKKVENMLI